MKRFRFFILFVLITGLTTIASAQEENQAGLVILLEDGSVITRCVTFSEPEISGLELLARAEVDLVTSVEFMGASVCSLAGQGCPAEDCFCQCKGGDCVYWSYWHRQETGWEYSVAGASVYSVSDGDFEGWTWGLGTPQNAVEPPLLTFDEVCPPETAETAPPTAESAAGPTAIAAAPSVAATPAAGQPDTIAGGPAAAQEDDPDSAGYFNYLLFVGVLLLLGGLLIVRRGQG